MTADPPAPSRTASAPGTLCRHFSRLQDALRREVIAKAQPDLRITFSAGLVAMREGENMDQALERADQALYRAKANGRNRSEAANDKELAASRAAHG